jgi:hypothetical protein
MHGNKKIMKNLLAEDLDHILEHTRDLWEEVRGEQNLITGGTGFFGHWLLESFLWINQRLKLGSRMTGLTRSPQAFIAKNPFDSVRLKEVQSPGTKCAGIEKLQVLFRNSGAGQKQFCWR